MKTKQKAQVEYLKERQMALVMLRHATFMHAKTKNPEFVEYMKWISDRLTQLKHWRDDGTYLREAEKKEETAKMFREDYQRMVKEGAHVADHIRLVHLKDMAV